MRSAESPRSPDTGSATPTTSRTASSARTSGRSAPRSPAARSGSRSAPGASGRTRSPRSFADAPARDRGMGPRVAPAPAQRGPSRETLNFRLTLVTPGTDRIARKSRSRCRRSGVVTLPSMTAVLPGLVRASIDSMFDAASEMTWVILARIPGRSSTWTSKSTVKETSLPTCHSTSISRLGSKRRLRTFGQAAEWTETPRPRVT